MEVIPEKYNSTHTERIMLSYVKYKPRIISFLQVTSLCNAALLWWTDFLGRFVNNFVASIKFGLID